MTQPEPCAEYVAVRLATILGFGRLTWPSVPTNGAVEPGWRNDFRWETGTMSLEIDSDSDGIFLFCPTCKSVITFKVARPTVDDARVAAERHFGRKCNWCGAVEGDHSRCREHLDRYSRTDPNGVCSCGHNRSSHGCALCECEQFDGSIAP